MPRWGPEAEARLRDAALDLCAEHGYDAVTVAQITDRAGLTRRTFSRYFTDKRDVFFAGSERLPPAMAAAVRAADPALPPFAALLAAFAEIGTAMAELVPNAARRRAIIQSSAELRERERTKSAAITDAAITALHERGTPDPDAILLANTAVAVFAAAFQEWTGEPGTAFRPHLDAIAARLAGSILDELEAPPGRG